MERQIPKNVRQIGNVSGSPKIYVEDYVDTFLGQLSEKAGENPMGAFLIGEIAHTENEDYVYIYGAIQMHELKKEERGYLLDEPTWKQAYDDCKQYFEGGEMLGWCVVSTDVPRLPDIELIKLHGKSFPKENTVFMIKDAVEKEETFYVHRYNDLIEVQGHYNYYEKNPCMQNYMISCRKKNGVCHSETVEDRAAKDFRSLVRSREELNRQKRTSRVMYVTSACLVLIVLVMGVVTMNNFDKMRNVQNTLQALSGNADEVYEDKMSGEEKILDENGAFIAKGDVEEKETGKDAVNKDKTDTDLHEAGENIEAVSGTDGNVAGENTDSEAEMSQTNTMGEQQLAESKDLWNQESVETGGRISAETREDAESEDEENGEIYEVVDGDTLAKISQKVYGDISHIDAICRMNGLTDGNLIYIGQKLLLP